MSCATHRWARRTGCSWVSLVSRSAIDSLLSTGARGAIDSRETIRSRWTRGTLLTLEESRGKREARVSKWEES